MAYLNDVPDYQAEGTELPASKLINGFQAAEKPPANWFNYLFHKICMAIKELQQKTYEKTKIDADLALKFDKADIANATGTSTTKVISQSTATTELNKKIDKTSIAQATGTSTSNVMSQKAVSDNISTLNTNLGKKVNKESIVQTTGSGTETVMSQNATTNAINTAKNAVIAEIPIITKGTEKPSGGSDGDIYIRYS